MKLDFAFDPNDYAVEEEVSLPGISKNKPPIPRQKSSIKTDDISFDPRDYETEPEEHPYALQYAHLTKREYEALSPEGKKELQEYSPLKGFAKGVASGATLGATEHIPGMKTKEHEVGAGPGQFVGAAAPIGLIAKAMSYPVKAISGLMNFGRAATIATEISGSAATGATYSAGKQAIKGEGISGSEVAAEAAEFAAFHGTLLALFKGIPKGMDWVNSLKTGQRAEALVDGVIPKDLTPNQYKFYEQEIVPELQKSAAQKYQEAYQSAKEENDLEFSKKMENTKAEHENDLMKRAQKEQFNEQDFEQAKHEYQNKLKQVAAEHESKVAEIEKENQAATEQFQKDMKYFEKMKTRQKIVQDAIKPKESETDLRGRVRPQAEDVGYRPAPTVEQNPSVRNQVGSIFSPNEIQNESLAGQTNVNAIRANDAVDYQDVREAYTISDRLSETVQAEHPDLALEMTRLIDELNQIPELSPPRKQLLTIAQKIRDRIAVFNEEGIMTGFKPVSNKILQDQAKELRYFMDFNFEHGNTRGIFSPLVNTIEDAAELAANTTNNQAAYEASRNSRRLYRQWAEDYDNDYIRPFRDVKNRDYIKLFNETTNPDTYPIVDNILSRSNAGQQISASNKRALIDKTFKKFFDNPRKVNPEELNDAFKKVRGVITPGEEKSIRESFNEGRRTPVIKGKKTELPEAPKEPKLKEVPGAKIPLFKEKLKTEPPIEQVKIPLKPKVKVSDSMRASAKIMKITPEQAMKKADTPTGMKELKDHLPEKLFKKVGQDKVKDIIYQGKIKHKFTGKELYDIINEGENYEMLSEILGEEVTAELHVSAEQIANKTVTVDALKKAGVHALKLKALLKYGIL